MPTQFYVEQLEVTRWLSRQPGLVLEWDWDGQVLNVDQGGAVTTYTRRQLLESGCNLGRHYGARHVLEELTGKQAVTTSVGEKAAKDLDRMRKVAKDIYSQGGDHGTRAEISGSGRRLARKASSAGSAGRRLAGSLATSQTPGVSIKAAAA